MSKTVLLALTLLALTQNPDAYGYPAADIASFTPPEYADPGEIYLQGLLALNTQRSLNLTVIQDDAKLSSDPQLRLDQLPPFSFQYVQNGRHLIPVHRGAIPSDHPRWEYILESGNIWQDPSQGKLSRVSLPFTLQERAANCMHNGLLHFTIDNTFKVSEAKVMIASETCKYLKFNLSGTLAASFQQSDIAGSESIIDAFKERQSAKLTARPIGALGQVYPEVELDAFAGRGKIPQKDISLYGYLIDGVHYLGQCQTRLGPHPFCQRISLPSYSLAKSLVAGLAAMRLEKLYPGSRHASIALYVPECEPNGIWDDVTFEHALNMVTGNYSSEKEHVDENSAGTETGFFIPSGHREKINFSCNAWPRKAKPGSQWVYHSTDSYLLGAAINARLKQEKGPDAELFRDLVMPLWQGMNLGPALATPRRSYDSTAQVFADFGLTLTADDIARLADALNRDIFASQLDSEMYNSAMQRLPQPQGYRVPGDNRFRYSNGFWAYNAQTLLGCEQPVMIPFMSGYGGISVLMMPNDTVYYIFTDSGVFAFADVIVQSHRIRNMCPKRDEPR